MFRHVSKVILNYIRKGNVFCSVLLDSLLMRIRTNVLKTARMDSLLILSKHSVSLSALLLRYGKRGKFNGG